MANQLWENSQATLILWMTPRNMNKEKPKQYFDTTLLMYPNVIINFGKCGRGLQGGAS